MHYSHSIDVISRRSGHAQGALPAAARCVLPALRAVGHLAGAAGATGAAALLRGGAVGAALACLRAPPPGAAVTRAEAAWVLGNLAGLPGRCAGGSPVGAPLSRLAAVRCAFSSKVGSMQCWPAREPLVKGSACCAWERWCVTCVWQRCLVAMQPRVGAE